MIRRESARLGLVLATTGILVALTACGGSASGGEGAGVLRDVSFGGAFSDPTITVPNPNGANSGGAARLPAIFSNEELSFVFDAPVSTTVLGGLLTDANGNRVILNASRADGTDRPYWPFADQVAARQAIQLRQNVANSALVGSYAVGVATTESRRLVIDTEVTAPEGALLGVPTSAGLMGSTEYTYRIPAGTGLRIGNALAQPLGVLPSQLPVIIAEFLVTPPQPLVILTSANRTPDTSPLTLVSIEADVTNNPTFNPGDPLGVTQPILITFSRPIDPLTADTIRNLRVTNLTLGNSIAPGVFDFDPAGLMAGGRVVRFTPRPGWGGGAMGVGNRIQVAVSLIRDGTGAPLPGANIQSVPFGVNGDRITLTDPGMAGIVEFDVVFDATAPTAVSITENFDNPNATRDLSAQPAGDPNNIIELNDARWNDPVGSNSLRGVFIDGSARAPFNGRPNGLGTRIQFSNLMANELTAMPAGLVSPFDDATTNLGAPNPMGGSHFMLLMTASDTPGNSGVEDNLELVEWGPPNNRVTTTTYARCRLWAGQTSAVGDANPCANGAGLVTNYLINHDIPNSQPVDPQNSQDVGLGLGGVLLFDGPYAINPVFTSYYAYPDFIATRSRTFEYRGLTTQPVFTPGAGGQPPVVTGNANMPSMVIEVDIEPGTHRANFTRHRSTGPTPVRRLIAPSLVSGMGFASATTGCETHDYRFTFVALNSSARSRFYDSGISGGLARYTSFEISPAPQNQPAGSYSKWEVQGAMAITNQTTPAPGAATAWLTYYETDPLNPTLVPDVSVLANNLGNEQLSGNQFVRWRLVMENDVTANGIPLYNNIVIGITDEGPP